MFRQIILKPDWTKIFIVVATLENAKREKLQFKLMRSKRFF